MNKEKKDLISIASIGAIGGVVAALGYEFIASNPKLKKTLFQFLSELAESMIEDGKQIGSKKQDRILIHGEEKNAK